MSQKNRDYQGRWRNKVIAFRVSPEENLLLNRKVLLSGLTKQDYLIHCMSDQSFVVQGNPYAVSYTHLDVYKRQVILVLF